MIAYKCIASGRRFVEVSPKNSTRRCSACGSLSGPTAYAALSVRAWACAACGAAHDRDVNAAINTLLLGLGTSHENRCEAVSGISSTINTEMFTSGDRATCLLEGDDDK
jgi:transposase